MIADTPEKLAAAAVELLTNRVLYEKIAKNARALVEENYTYQVIAKKLDEIYKKAVNE
jgi:glycosyltransferase involved in cell wall biosynthesis